jgi:predicted RNase H-like HicB family nuclease
VKHKSTVIIHKEGKLFVARSLELGVTSQGKSIEEAKNNLLEAVELYLEDAPKERKILAREHLFVTSIELK